MRWAGPSRWAGSPSWGDFYPTSMHTLSHFNEKVCHVAGKRLFWFPSFLTLPVPCISESWIEIEIKGALSGVRQFSATESSLKVMKNAFYFTSKALFVLKIFKFLSWLFGHVAKRLDKNF